MCVYFGPPVIFGLFYKNKAEILEILLPPMVVEAKPYDIEMPSFTQMRTVITGMICFFFIRRLFEVIFLRRLTGLLTPCNRTMW